MLFADVVKFSRLTEEQFPRFVEEFLGAAAALAARSPYAPIMRNTWGDALYFVFDRVEKAGNFALDLRDLLCRADWAKKGLPEALSLRIALHAGPVYSCENPVTERSDFIGYHVNRAARLEPKTPEGCVYASQSFVAMAAARGVKTFEWDYVGQIPMPKDFGTFPTYRLRRAQSLSEKS